MSTSGIVNFKTYTLPGTVLDEWCETAGLCCESDDTICGGVALPANLFCTIAGLASVAGPSQWGVGYHTDWGGVANTACTQAILNDVTAWADGSYRMKRVGTLTPGTGNNSYAAGTNAMLYILADSRPVGAGTHFEGVGASTVSHSPYIILPDDYSTTPDITVNGNNIFMPISNQDGQGPSMSGLSDAPVLLSPTQYPFTVPKDESDECAICIRGFDPGGRGMWGRTWGVPRNTSGTMYYGWYDDFPTSLASCDVVYTQWQDITELWEGCAWHTGPAGTITSGDANPMSGGGGSGSFTFNYTSTGPAVTMSVYKQMYLVLGCTPAPESKQFAHCYLLTYIVSNERGKCGWGLAVTTENTRDVNAVAISAYGNPNFIFDADDWPGQESVFPFITATGSGLTISIDE